jgi:hypothetical protein
MACWTVGDPKSRCKDRGLVDTFQLSATVGQEQTFWQDVKDAFRTKFNLCQFQDMNVNVLSSSVKGITYDGCQTMTGSFTECKPLATFGSYAASGIARIENQNTPVVKFSSNCYYEPLTSESTGYFTVYGPVWEWSNCKGGCTPTSTEKGEKAGLFVRGMESLISNQSLPPEAIIVQERAFGGQIDNLRGISQLVMGLNKEKTCPALGNKSILQTNFTMCKDDQQAQCTYATDTIAGGCEDSECVKRGFNKFMAQVTDMLDPEKTVVDPGGQAARNMGLARLVEGLTEKGKCGEADFTCLKKVGTDCRFIAEAASDIQPKSQLMYEALVRAQRVCQAQL